MICLSANANSASEIGFIFNDTIPSIVFVRLLALLNYIGSRNISILTNFFFLNENPAQFDFMKADLLVDDLIIDNLERGTFILFHFI